MGESGCRRILASWLMNCLGRGNKFGSQISGIVGCSVVATPFQRLSLSPKGLSADMSRHQFHELKRTRKNVIGMEAHMYGLIDLIG